MTTPPPVPNKPFSTDYAGFSRFDIELEFVQLLAIPQYLHHLATTAIPPASLPIPGSETSAAQEGDVAPIKLFSDPRFIAYLNYLRYWKRPEYARFLRYPEPTLKNLDLLTDERFRRDLADVEVVARMVEAGVKAFDGDKEAQKK